jgi:hypothetical protein
MSNVTVKMEVQLRGVISKSLVGEVMSAVHTASPRLIYTNGSTLDFSSIVDFMEDYMREMQAAKQISTFDVICDTRNNDPASSRAQVIIDCKFRQYNCLLDTLVKIKFTASE